MPKLKKNELIRIIGVILCIALVVCILLFAPHTKSDDEAQDENGTGENVPTSIFDAGSDITSPTVTPDPSVVKDGANELFEYSIADGAATINNVLDDQVKSVTVPEQIEGYPVKTIGFGAFRMFDKLEEVILPDTVTLIAEYAFEECTHLNEVILPSSLEEIGDYAFCGCTSLKTIIIPKSVTTFGASIFYECSNLTEITINQPKDLADIFDLSFVQKVTITNGCTFIPEEAFYQMDSLKEVIIPSSVLTIKSCAFFECTGLEKVTLGTSVMSIGESAFEGCTLLNDIVFPETLSMLGDLAFYNCESLTELYIPEELTVFGDEVFDWCTKLIMNVKADSAAALYAENEGIMYAVR